MKTYKTNKTIFENYKCAEFTTPVYNFPLANNFTFKQLGCLNNDFILFDCLYTLRSEACPNCMSISLAVKEYKYIYPIIGEINGKVVIARIRKRSFRCNNPECDCKCFIQTIPQITKRHRFSKLVNEEIINCLNNTISYKYIASRFKTSITTVLRLIDKLVIKGYQKLT